MMAYLLGTCFKEDAMAKLSTWQMIYPLFAPKELGHGAYENMQDDFLVSLYRFRVAMDIPMIVHEAYATSGHAPNSYHYQGRALDFHFKYKNIPLRRVVVAAITSGLYGIGFYPWWSPYPGGFHLDNRSASKFNIWNKTESGIYIYLFDDTYPETLDRWGA